MPIDFHIHNGVDAPRINYINVLNALRIDDTTDSSNTTTPWSANKIDSYIDDSYEDVALYDIIASGTVVTSADTTRGGNEASYTKTKEIKHNDVDGILRVTFDLDQLGVSGDAFGKVYVNGSPIGAEHTNNHATGWESFSDDIAVSKDDLVQLYSYTSNTVDGYSYRNFRIQFDKKPKTTPGTVNLN